MSRKKIDLTLNGLTIEAVAAEGRALTHYEGEVVFVEFAVPGDVVDIRVTKKKKKHMEGRILRIVQPSPQRIAPFCTHFGVCGGCKWQPLPYEMQLEAKRQQVYDQLVRIGHLEVPEIRPTIGSERTQLYRNKLEFTFSDRRWILDGEDPDALTPEERASSICADRVSLSIMVVTAAFVSAMRAKQSTATTTNTRAASRPIVTSRDESADVRAVPPVRTARTSEALKRSRATSVYASRRYADAAWAMPISLVHFSCVSDERSGTTGSAPPSASRCGRAGFV